MVDRRRDKIVSKLYRTTTIGTALTQTLQDLLNAREIDED